jgi:hypothetical protein
MLPAIVSAYLIAFTTSFDEYAVASFVKGSTVTFPVYLYAALRFPNQLPQVIAVAVVVISVSLLVVVACRGRSAGRRAPARGARGRLERAAARLVEHGRVLRLPLTRRELPGSSGDQLVCEAVAHEPTGAVVDVELRVHAEVDDLGDRSRRARAVLGRWRRSPPI